MPKIIKNFPSISLLCVLLALLHAVPVRAQIDNPINGSVSRQYYIVGDVTVSGARYLDTTVIKTILGVFKGDQVALPNDEKIAKGIRTIWSQGLMEQLSVNVVRIKGDTVYLDIAIQERPKLVSYSFEGVTNNQKAEIKEKLDKSIGGVRVVSEAMKREIRERIQAYFNEKGYSKARVWTIEQKDATFKDNSVNLRIKVDKGPKVRINQINIVGNKSVGDLKLKRKMKNSKEMVRLSLYPAYRTSLYGNEPMTFNSYWHSKGPLTPSKTLEYLDPYFRYKVFSVSKFDNRKYEDDKRALVNYYNAIGHRDAIIVRDTVYDAGNNNLNIDIQLKEGRKYYFGDIKWSGNTKYSDSLLTEVLGIKKGDVYNKELLDAKLGMVPSMDGSLDLGALYLDQGYLFFSADAQETAIVGDTINYRINIYEGPQATIKRIIIKGNEKTNDYVIRRELFTLPGNKFSRADLIRSIRQISQLGYIDPENINPIPKPNTADNTVDIEYNVKEKPSDQLEATIGYGGRNIGVQGSVGITLNNFSAKNLFNRREWRPVPMGDGQQLSLRWMSNGVFYNSANFSFTEPWLGGKKPISLTFGTFYSKYALGTYTSDGFQVRDSSITNYGASVTVSKRLRWPDNNFVGAVGLNYQRYKLRNYPYLDFNSGFTTGTANNLYLLLSLSRNSVDNPIFPRSGSELNFTVQLTPPISLLGNTDYKDATIAEKYKWIEFHKYRFTANWYQKVHGDLILRISSKLGYLGYYNPDIGYSIFERFQMGGDGMSGFNMFIGKDIISQRGYEMYNDNAVIFNKYTTELRYPFSLNPNSTIYGLAFFEAGNAWNSFKEYNPFQLNRAVGLGVRLRLPMFGLLGFDYGFGFDAYQPGSKLSSAFKFTFMLGREPE